jgi:hypothetical protein
MAYTCPRRNADRAQHADTGRINLITAFIQQHVTDPIYISMILLSMWA